MRKNLLTFLLLTIFSYLCFSQTSDSALISLSNNDKIDAPNETSDSIPIPEYPLMNKIEVTKSATIATTQKSLPLEEKIKPILLAIKVVDKKTNIPLQAIVQTIAHPNSTGQGVCNVDGKFHFNINNHSDIEIRIAQPGYHTYIDTINIIKEGFNGNIYTKVYPLTPFQKGDIVALDNIYFKQGDDHLLPNSYPALNKLAEMMHLNPNMAIQLGGHTENKGSKKQLIELSQKRVNSVRFYLLQKGIKINRIKTIGYGPSKPIYHGNDAEQQKMNRRVDFKIIKF